MMMHKRISKGSCTDTQWLRYGSSNGPLHGTIARGYLWAGQGLWDMWDGNFPSNNVRESFVDISPLIPTYKITSSSPTTATMATDQIYRASTFAPVNIAVIKYVAIHK